MEGVEDIPGTALHEGIAWDWESFPQYLDALDKTPRALDVAAQVPHAALRAYVMGERAHEREATADEIAEMSKLAEDGLRAGACGISTSRTILHSSQHGLVPGTDAPPEELLALGEAIGRAGHGVFQLVSDHQGGAGDRAWLVDLVERTGATATYALAQAPLRPRRAGATRSPPAPRTAPPVAGSSRRSPCRPTGMLFGLQSSLHPFFTHPTYRDLADLPLAERVARLSQPEVRAALLADEPRHQEPDRPRAHAAVGADLPARRPARLRAAPLGEHRRRRPSARAARRRRSRSTGCSSATARRSCSRRWPATSTTTTKRSAR